MKRLSPPLKWHGGKHYLAGRLVAMMPRHTHYVEPYYGGGAVLLAKSFENTSEVVSDLDCHLINFWRVLRDEDLFQQLQRLCEATPVSELVWNIAEHPHHDRPAFWAWRFFVLCRQSLAGRMDTFTPLSRTRTRRGMNEQASAWLTAIEGLQAVHDRLKRVVILNRPALDVIRGQDGRGTLFYLDPPYLHETRSTTGNYEHEMSALDHSDLLNALAAIEGKFLLSGYTSNLYRLVAKQYGWHRTDFELPNNSAGGKTKRRMIESVWSNFKPKLR